MASDSVYNLAPPLGRMFTAWAATVTSNLVFPTTVGTVTSARVPIAISQQPVVTGYTLQVRLRVYFDGCTAGDQVSYRLVDDTASTVLVTDTVSAAGGTEWFTGSWVNAPASTAGWFVQHQNATAARGNTKRVYIETQYVAT